MNIVSIRDGSKPGKLNFFIHIDQNNGDCIGELKGIANMVSANVAEYRQTGDACALRFTFTTSSITLKEDELCGQHRGVKCSFDGNFPRKKEIKKQIKKK